jgi:hypothetical protein
MDPSLSRGQLYDVQNKTNTGWAYAFIRSFFSQLNLLEADDGDFFDLQFVVDSYTDDIIKPLLNYRLKRSTKYLYKSNEDLLCIMYGVKVSMLGNFPYFPRQQKA